MVLESLIRAGFARKHPVSMLVNAILLCSAGIILGLYTFPQSASVLSLAVITFGITPVLYIIFVHEEKEEACAPGNPMTFLERHFDIIQVYSWFFIGLIISYAVWYYGLSIYAPEQRDLAFLEQEKTWGQITGLRGNVTGALTGGACASSNMASLAIECVFFNNAMVLVWAIIFSLVLGVGSIFLIAWNASVIGLVIGKELLATNAMNATMRAIGLIPHGIPEVVAYFIGAIAGGIISVGITKKKYKCKEFETILKDAFVLVITAFVMLFVAAVIEAYLILNA